jgi:hypothetical protein
MSKETEDKGLWIITGHSYEQLTEETEENHIYDLSGAA